MSKIDELRANLTENQRKVINTVWAYELEKNTPIPTSALYHRLGKDMAASTLRSLNGSIVKEYRGDGTHRCGLTFLGKLLTDGGKDGEELLMNVLGYVQSSLRSDPEFNEISSKNLKESLGFTDEQIQTLWQYLFHSPFSGGGGGGSPTGWQFGVSYYMRNDLPLEDDLSGYFEKYALEGYDPNLPVLQDERDRYLTSKKSKPTIFLVDDKPQWSEAIKDSLRPDYDVVSASSAETVDQVLGSNHGIDLIVLDIDLASSDEKGRSGRSGLNITRSLREKAPNLPILFTSAHDEVLRPRIDEAVNWFEKSKSMSKDALSRSIREAVDRTLFESEISKSGSSQTPRLAHSGAGLLERVMEEVNKYADVRAETINIPGAGNYYLMKPLVGYKKEIERQLAKFPFEKNVFLMMKFRESNKDLSDFIIENLKEHGLNGVRADQNEWNITRDVYNPIAVLYCCKFGIALFDEPEEHQAYSANVAYELGMMHYQNKDCLILRHNSLPAVPFDLIKNLYMPYKRDLEVKRKIADWIKQISSQ